MRRHNVANVTERFAMKRETAEKESEKKLLELHSELPELFEIDRELSSTSLAVLNIAMSGENIEQKMTDLRSRNEELRKKRAGILIAAGYPEDYTDVHFECDKCRDTGFVGINMCECMKKEVALAAFEDSGIGALVKTQSFETFSFDYYNGDCLKYMKMNYELLKDFAESFSTDTPRNFLLMGNTGLGKTHLSTAVAKTVIEKGYKVTYSTISDILSDFEEYQFRDNVSDDEIKSRYYSADLLIIDDLGCEVSNKFTVSCIYNLINSRINNRRSTIISTNLTYDELRDTYADRITSRILGEFRPLMFTGQDIRKQKLAKK